MNLKITVFFIVGVIIIILTYYFLNERVKGLENKLAMVKPTNNYFNNNFNTINKIEQKIDKIEGTNVIVGDNNTTNVNNQKTTI